ncbi:hypothetical protein RFI_28108 [Reticulomyxa filosa]|uniref:MATH domain-containing protein n=1 Tax=Reticulomyxa filosa TaxID=46433 RepID=X6M8C6_RETFI|nr:hypothetical protein RFI_28108 [Reticulomyxa filosa]|eukprot:ETO09280.1 hypothetical protein RFI_28108 [Reticulomyxa filosa]
MISLDRHRLQKGKLQTADFAVGVWVWKVIILTENNDGNKKIYTWGPTNQYAVKAEFRCSILSCKSESNNIVAQFAHRFTFQKNTRGIEKFVPLEVLMNSGTYLFNGTMPGCDSLSSNVIFLKTEVWCYQHIPINPRLQAVIALCDKEKTANVQENNNSRSHPVDITQATLAGQIPIIASAIHTSTPIGSTVPTTLDPNIMALHRLNTNVASPTLGSFEHISVPNGMNVIKVPLHSETVINDLTMPPLEAEANIDTKMSDVANNNQNSNVFDKEQMLNNTLEITNIDKEVKITPTNVEITTSYNEEKSEIPEIIETKIRVFVNALKFVAGLQQMMIFMIVFFVENQSHEN